MQNTVNMGKTSIIKTFNTATFETIYLAHTSNSTSCADPTYMNCNLQTIPNNLFENFEYEAGSKVAQTLEEPITLEISDITQNVDEYTGYTTSYDTYKELRLNTGKAFFAGVDESDPTLAKITVNIDTTKGNYYEQGFLNAMYPANGTVSWAIGEQNETYTQYRDMLGGETESGDTYNSGDVDSIILISAYTGAMAIMLIFLGAFCNCYRYEKSENARRDSIMMSGEEYDIALNPNSVEHLADQKFD